MSENLTLLQLRDDRLHWCEPASGRDRVIDDDDVAREALIRELQERQHQVVFAVPGGDVRLLELPVSAEERRHLESALPFMLEEQMSDDVEQLHFARRALDAEQFAVAVVARQKMDQWGDALGSFAAQLPWVPEALLLPWDPGSWTMVLEEDLVILRYGHCRGATLERPILGAFLESLADESPPERVLVYGYDEDRDRAALSGTLSSMAEWRRGGWEAALLLSSGSRDCLDLRQGDYAPRLPYERWWSQWRVAAGALAIAVGVHLLAGWLDYQRLERQNLALRQEIESLYREVNPRGAVVDPEKQLRRQLADLQGGSTDATFTGLLAPLGDAMARRDDMLLASLNYSRRNGELRINLLAASFAEVEGLRTDLIAAGLEASLENSSRSGDRVRARLRLGDGA